MKEGWICPRCGSVNAPFIGQCTCKPDNTKKNSNIAACMRGKHTWKFMGSSPLGMKYGCTICGDIEYKPFTTPDGDI